MTGQFDHLLNWRLLKGGHDFPGPDGGTCINEAAVVAAGLPYRRIMGVSDLPECFSEPLSMFALGLNDMMGDEERDRLMPFVMRLAGTRDTVEVERERAELILVQAGRRVFAPLMRSSALSIIADDLERVERRKQLRAETMHRMVAAVAKVQPSPAMDAASVRGRHCVHAAESFSLAIRSNKPARIASNCAFVVGYAANADFAQAPRIYDVACEILDAACKIGRQPDPVAVPLIQERFEAARGRERIPEPA